MITNLKPKLVVLFTTIAMFALPVAAHANQIKMYGGLTGTGGKCLDDPGASHAPITWLWIYPCNGTPAQNWTPQFLFWSHYPDVPVYLWHNAASGLCLAVKYNSWANGTPAIQYYCNPNDRAEQIETSYNPFGGVTFRHYGTEKCLDNQYNRNATGNHVWWYSCNGAGAQEWEVWMN